MHGFEEATAAPPDDPTDKRPWYQLLNRYHWFVLVVAALGWLFDCLDQQLFILARPQAMAELILADQRWRLKSRICHSGANSGRFWHEHNVGRLCDERLYRRLGHRRTDLRHARRPHWPGKDDAHYHSDVLALHGSKRPFISVYDFAFYRFLTGLGVGANLPWAWRWSRKSCPRGLAPTRWLCFKRFPRSAILARRLINLGLGLAEGEGMLDSPVLHSLAWQTVPGGSCS